MAIDQVYCSCPIRNDHRVRCRFEKTSEFLLLDFQCRHVADDFGETVELARAVEEGSNQDVRPEPGSVFTDPDVLFFKLSFASRGLQHPHGPAASDLIGRVEAREMLSHNLISGVALDPLGARIPCRYETIRIDNIERGVANTFDQEAKPFFALDQLFLDRFRTW